MAESLLPNNAGRSVSGARRWILAAVLVGMLLLVVGSGLLLLSITIKAYYQELAAQVQTVSANITGCQTFQVSAKNGRSYPRGRLSYQFIYQDKVYTGQLETSPCDNSTQFTTLPIKFLASDPTKSGSNVETVIGDGGSQTLAYAAMICFIWTLLGPATILGAYYQRRKYSYLVNKY